VFSRGKREKEFKKGQNVALMCRPSSCYHPLHLSHIIIDSVIAVFNNNDIPEKEKEKRRRTEVGSSWENKPDASMP